MGNLMTSLWTGVSGLTVSQSGLNTTAHNLSNVNTQGYSRQQMINVDFNYNFIGYNYEGQKLNVGLGSTADVVRQLRNRFYDETYREEVGRQGYYEGQWEALSEIQELFGEMEGVAFQNSLESIWDAIQELAKEPESIVCRSTLVNRASEFIDRAQDIYTQISKFQTDLNKQVQTAVNRINELGQTIYEMNKKVAAAEASGVENANDYRDTRNLALDELSKYIKIEYSEDANGVVQVVAEGVQFVSELSVNQIITKEISDDTLMLKPIWSQTGDDVVSRNKSVGAKELDAIIASAAMQVPTTYFIESYVINSGNVISATANITLRKNDEKISGLSNGDGPIDAAFLAIEQIIGRHYELDDFQIQSVTEGREAMGSALVKLRSDGKLYSGKGISTDIIGASIRAYLNAVNKIVYEEA